MIPSRRSRQRRPGSTSARRPPGGSATRACASSSRARDDVVTKRRWNATAWLAQSISMTDSEFMKRIDAEVARTNELLEQDRIAWRQAMDEHGGSLQDIRFEMRQMSVRGERLAQGYLRAI